MTLRFLWKWTTFTESIAPDVVEVILVMIAAPWVGVWGSGVWGSAAVDFHRTVGNLISVISCLAAFRHRVQGCLGVLDRVAEFGHCLAPQACLVGGVIDDCGAVAECR